MALISPERNFGNYSFSLDLQETESELHIRFEVDVPQVVLHWGVGITKNKEWKAPIEIEGITLPPSTVKFDEKAAQSPFASTSNVYSLSISVLKSSPVLQINFVFKKENSWFNNNSNDYFINIKPPVLPKILKDLPPDLNNALFEIIDSETNGGAWTLMHRFKLCNSLVERQKNSLEGLAWIFVWMRYSAIRKLDWQRNYNTKPVELAWSQRCLSCTITNLLKPNLESDLVGIPTVLKGVLLTIGKSGENGQRIRDEILHIMSRGKIKHHKPALDKHNYYEQWHQKLHNNTTFDDIGICEAVIVFNETGQMEKYWETLAKHGITKERLCSFDRPITVEPYLAPQIVKDLYSYLDLLKSVHGSVDLKKSADICKGFVPASLSAGLTDLCANLSHWDKISQMERVLKCRKELKSSYGVGGDQFRELVYLDLALEGYIKQLCEEIIHIDIELKYQYKELKIIIENILIYSKNQEISSAFYDFCKFSELNTNEYEDALLVKSSIDRIQRTLGSYIDTFSSLIDTKAKFLGEQFGIDQETQTLFVEELIRSTLFFSVSLLLKKIDKSLTKHIGYKSCLIISPKQVQGILLEIDSLTSISFEKFKENTIFICEKVSGEEDIPEGVVGVISKSHLDTLAHVSVRARNSGVFLAVVLDTSLLEKFFVYLNTPVSVSISNGTFDIKPASSIESTHQEDSPSISLPLPFEHITLDSNSFSPGKTGSKSNNCRVLSQNCQGVTVPLSSAIPFRSFEQILEKPYNSSISSQISGVIASELDLSPDTTLKLQQIQDLILELQITDPEKSEIESMLRPFNCRSWEKAWLTIKKVWASKYNLRVFLSTLKARISLEAVCMSVLVQEVIDADYAFVLHTKNPTNDNEEEIFGEIVLGLGETLVSAKEGRALSFVINKRTGEAKLESFSNKGEVLKGEGIIFRSDSNSEDLKGFAGAGLFDSFVMDGGKSEVPRYADSGLIMNRGERLRVFSKLREIGVEVEGIFGSAQDIEGCIKDGRFYLVQSRPQV